LPRVCLQESLRTPCTLAVVPVGGATKGLRYGGLERSRPVKGWSGSVNQPHAGIVQLEDQVVRNAGRNGLRGLLVSEVHPCNVA
jgi:hypothetical protein